MATAGLSSVISFFFFLRSESSPRPGFLCRPGGQGLGARARAIDLCAYGTVLLPFFLLPAPPPFPGTCRHSGISLGKITPFFFPGVTRASRLELLSGGHLSPLSPARGSGSPLFPFTRGPPPAPVRGLICPPRSAATARSYLRPGSAAAPRAPSDNPAMLSPLHLWEGLRSTYSSSLAAIGKERSLLSDKLVRCRFFQRRLLPSLPFHLGKSTQAVLFPPCGRYAGPALTLFSPSAKNSLPFFFLSSPCRAPGPLSPLREFSACRLFPPHADGIGHSLSPVGQKPAMKWSCGGPFPPFALGAIFFLLSLQVMPPRRCRPFFFVERDAEAYVVAITFCSPSIAPKSSFLSFFFASDHGHAGVFPSLPTDVNVCPFIG